MMRQFLSAVPRPLKKIGRAVLDQWFRVPEPPVSCSAPSLNEHPDERWLRLHIEARRPRLRTIARKGQFSLLTYVYERSPATLFSETADALRRQTCPDFEWVLLAQGTLPADLEQTVTRVSADRRVKLIRAETNLGIINGARKCLEAATGEYVIPLDGDDLLTPDALQVLAQAIADHGAPPFLYTDEDFFVGGRPQSPYLRPDWDPVLNLTGSYIWHLCAFRRDLALEVGVYSDCGSEFCQDWDTVCRFANAGFAPVHIPEVVYHWRAHDHSSTNTADPNRGSLASQRHIVDMQVQRQPNPELYDIQPFPIFRGAHEWWIERRRVRPAPAEFIYCTNPSESPQAMVDGLVQRLDEARYPFQKVHLLGTGEISEVNRRQLIERLDQLAVAHSQPGVEGDAVRCWPAAGIGGFGAIVPHLSDGMTVVCRSGLTPQGETWPWESLRMFEFHDDLALIAGRIINPDNIVIGGGEVFGYGGISGCVEYARPAGDPGPFALFLKQRTVSAVNSAFFVARADFLRHATVGVRAVASLEFLGAWLGLLAAEEGLRVAVSPLLAARAAPGLEVTPLAGAEEHAAFARRLNRLAEQRAWYSPHFSPLAGQAYQLRAA